MDKLKNRLKAFIALCCLPILSLLTKKPRRVILYYHGVMDHEISNFDRQMRYLSTYSTVVPLSKLHVARDRGLITAITFDDAYANQYHNALPTLKKYGIPAAIFVPPANLGTLPAWKIKEGCSDMTELIMNERDLKGLLSSGIEIYSHTMTHPNLTELDDKDLFYELAESKKVLEGKLAIPINAISYPYGKHDNRVVAMAKNAGYTLGYTIEPELIDEKSDLLRLGRTSVYPTDGFVTFWLKFHGAYRVFSLIKSCKRLKLMRITCAAAVLQFVQSAAEIGCFL